MSAVRVVDVTDAATFALVPPCADPSFEHRTCDYWENAERGSKAARPSWLAPRAPERPARRRTGNPFLDDAAEPAVNPFAPASGGPPDNPFAPRTGPPAVNPFLSGDDDEPVDNPFAPKRQARPTVGSDAPPKLGLLGRGLAVFGSYAKVLLVDDVAVGYSQFGPLSAYPRAMRVRDLYPQLPEAPLPAVITCIATTREARRQGLALRLVDEVCADLARRGFAAVEAYPEPRAPEDATSAAVPAFWERVGFVVAVDDERFPVMRREL